MYNKLMAKMKQLMKLRHGVIKQYFEKHKYKKNYRNEIIEAAEESEKVIKQIMGEDHVHFMDANPEIREFMEQVNRDNERKIAEVLERKGYKQGDLPDIARLRLDPTAKAEKPKKSVSSGSYVSRVASAYGLDDIDVKAFESPSSLTEDSSDDSKPLGDRGFNLSYKDMMGVTDLKTTADEVSTTEEQTDSATETQSASTDKAAAKAS